MIVATLKDHAFSASDSGNKRRRDEPSDSEDDDSDGIEVVEPAVGWVYVGSHNFTPSAWGTLSGSSFNPVLNVRSSCYYSFIYIIPVVKFHRQR